VHPSAPSLSSKGEAMGSVSVSRISSTVMCSTSYLDHVYFHSHLCRCAKHSAIDQALDDHVKGLVTERAA
jgi:hypothetical protein